MLDLYVCVGSACHLKGSYAIINRLQSLIGASPYADRLNLMAVLCLGRCGGDVSIRIGEDDYFSIKPEETDFWFEHEVLPRVREKITKE